LNAPIFFPDENTKAPFISAFIFMTVRATNSFSSSCRLLSREGKGERK
jgi:hypothetical protein